MTMNEQANRYSRTWFDTFMRTYWPEQTEREFAWLRRQPGRQITTTRRVDHHRLQVRIEYGPANGSDVMEWQLYTPDELAMLARRAGFEHVLACSEFDESLPPIREQPRMQIVLEKSDD